MPAPYAGGCLCAAVRYRLTAEPLTLYACHCTDCQRHTGSAFGLSMIVQRQALELLQGQPSEYAVEHDDGRRWQGRFCDACATRLWSEPRRFPQLATLRPGTFDDTRWLRPVGHIWTRSAQPWVPIPADALRYEKQPDDFMPMITAWRARRSSPQGES